MIGRCVRGLARLARPGRQLLVPFSSQNKHPHHHHHHDHSECKDPTHDHSTCDDPTHNHHHQEETDPLLTSIEEYKKANECLSQNDIVRGYFHFKEVRSILKNVNMTQHTSYIKLLKKLASCGLLLHQYKDCEDFLQERVDVIQDVMTDDLALYAAYNDLFAFYLRTSLDKALLLGKALLSEQEKSNIPLYLVKLFTLHTGVAAADPDRAPAERRLRSGEEALPRLSKARPFERYQGATAEQSCVGIHLAEDPGLRRQEQTGNLPARRGPHRGERILDSDSAAERGSSLLRRRGCEQRPSLQGVHGAAARQRDQRLRARGRTLR